MATALSKRGLTWQQELNRSTRIAETAPKMYALLQILQDEYKTHGKSLAGIDDIVKHVEFNR